MQHRTHFMEVDPSERAGYLSSLRSTYGNEILADELGLHAAHQRQVEVLRHALNARLLPDIDPEAGREPSRLLLSVTQHCTFACAHCWVFASPAADCFLSLEDLDAIHRHTALHQAPRWTVSGGEFFSLPHFAQVLERYPIDCIFSNGFWGYPQDRCRRYAARIAAALGSNESLGDKALTFILSYDTFHASASGSSMPLDLAIASIISELYAVLPRAALRISHARCGAQDAGYLDVIAALEKEGFAVSQTARLEANGSISTLSYRYQRQDSPAKELFVDTYPITPICRALLHGLAPDSSPGDVRDLASSAPRARYPYAVGPDGGVGLYQVLYAPPVPYWAGDLVHEAWSSIAARLARDPIAVALEQDGIGPILSFLERYAPALSRSLSSGMHMSQQYLYLVLLDPQRRLLLNTYLLRRAHAMGRLRSQDADLQALIQTVLETPDDALRQSGLRRLYASPAAGSVP